MTTRTVNVLASVIALAVLVAMVTIAVSICLPGEGFLFSVIAANAFTISVALATWSGVAWKGAEGFTTPEEWIFAFVGFSVISAGLVALDLSVANPGLSVIFTVAALALAFVALPSALRAWILERVARRNGVSKR